MDPKKAMKRVFEVVERERKSLGWGRSGQLDRRLRRSEGHVSRLLSGKRAMRLGQLFEIVEALDFEPGEFFATSFGTEYRLRPERFLLALERKAEPTSLMRRVDLVLETMASHEQGHRREIKPSPELSGAVRRLDQLRYTFPFRAKEEGLELLNTIVEKAGEIIDSAIFCEVLSSMGSIERVLNNFSLSAAYLRRGMTIAEAQKLPTRKADLLQRCCYLIADQGEYETAISFAAQAEEIYSLRHDLLGVGKTFVDRGIMYRRKGDVLRAVDFYKASLMYLNKDMWRLRVAVFQGLGLTSIDQENLEESQRYLDIACKEHKTREGFNWWKLVWLRGEIALRRGKLDDAESAFGQIHHLLVSQEYHIDAALVSVRLSKALFLSGKTEEMLKLASDVMQLLEPLRRETAVAEGVLNDFLRKALAGKVTSSFLDRAYERLKEEAQLKGELLS